MCYTNQAPFLCLPVGFSSWIGQCYAPLHKARALDGGFHLIFSQLQRKLRFLGSSSCLSSFALSDFGVVTSTLFLVPIFGFFALPCFVYKLFIKISPSTLNLLLSSPGALSDFLKYKKESAMQSQGKGIPGNDVSKYICMKHKHVMMQIVVI